MKIYVFNEFILKDNLTFICDAYNIELNIADKPCNGGDVKYNIKLFYTEKEKTEVDNILSKLNQHGYYVTDRNPYLTKNGRIMYMKDRVILSCNNIV